MSFLRIKDLQKDTEKILKFNYPNSQVPYKRPSGSKERLVEYLG